MSHPTPPQAEAALQQFREVLRQVEGRDVDPTSAPWDEIEKSVIKVLGGGFAPQNPTHQSVALMIAAAFAHRLQGELGAFWFPNRGAPEGAALGFPEAIVVLSPLEVSMQALGRGRLAFLDEITRDLRGVLGRAKFSPEPGAAAPPRLQPADYRRLFDPGLVQFVVLDEAKAKAAWESTPDAAAREIDDALGRMPAKVPNEARESMRRQIVGALKQLDASKTLGEQVPLAPSLVELLVLLHGAVAGTGFAPEELWHDIALPLLHVGAPEAFPPLDEEELAAAKQGADPLALYVEVVPYQVSAADEDGLLGVFPLEELQPVAEVFASAPSLRLVRVEASRLREPVSRFDAAKTRAAVERFKAQVTAAGAPANDGDPEGQGGSPLVEVSLELLSGLARVVAAVEEGGGSGRVLVVRRATEAEAQSEPALHTLRQALSAPRIVLA